MLYFGLRLRQDRCALLHGWVPALFMNAGGARLPVIVIFLLYNKKITSLILLGYYYHYCIIDGFCTLIMLIHDHIELLKA